MHPARSWIRVPGTGRWNTGLAIRDDSDCGMEAYYVRQADRAYSSPMRRPEAGVWCIRGMKVSLVSVATCHSPSGRWECGILQKQIGWRMTEQDLRAVGQD